MGIETERFVFEVLAKCLNLDDLYDLLNLVSEAPRELRDNLENLIDDLEED